VWFNDGKEGGELLLLSSCSCWGIKCKDVETEQAAQLGMVSEPVALRWLGPNHLAAEHMHLMACPIVSHDLPQPRQTAAHEWKSLPPLQLEALFGS
jgi:hypothetical protein